MIVYLDEAFERYQQEGRISRACRCRRSRHQRRIHTGAIAGHEGGYDGTGFASAALGVGRWRRRFSAHGSTSRRRSLVLHGS